MADTAAINSPDYWNHRFAEDWTTRGGAEQTSFFAKLAVAMLPNWFWKNAIKNDLSLIDVGCALGDGLPAFKARLPKNEISGADVSDVAIRMAKQRLPGFNFHVVAEDWSDAPRADIVICSNTLEHMPDWRQRLENLGWLAGKYVLAMVPFQEWQRIDEHVVTFDFSSFPAALPDGKKLLYFRIVDASRTPDSHWAGHQAIALYGSRHKAKNKVALPAADPYAGVDFRGRTAAQVKATLGSMRVNPSPNRAPTDVKPGVVDRINSEWKQKFEVSIAEMEAKHQALRAHYERILSERDASGAEAATKHQALRAHYERILSERDASGAEAQANHEALRAHYERILSERDASAAEAEAKHGDLRALYERLLVELDASRAEVEAKHQDLRAHYERILSERDAKGAEAEAKHQDLRTHYERISNERDAKGAEAEAKHQDLRTHYERILSERDAKDADAEAKHQALRTHYERILSERDAKDADAEAKHQALRAHYERIVSERDAKGAEAEAKHQALRAQYERVLGERDARIAELPALLAWQARFETLEASVRAQMAQQLQQSEERIRDLSEGLIAARVELERFKVTVELEKSETAPRLAEATTLLAQRELDLDSLRALNQRASVDIAAVKAGLRAAIDERDEARRGLLGPYEARLREADEHIAELEAEKSQFASVNQQLAAANAASHEQLNDVATLLDGLRLSWQGDLRRSSDRAVRVEQDADLLRTQLARVLGSKSWALATSARRAFWALRGNPGVAIETLPLAPAAPRSDASEFLSRWDRAKSVLSNARNAQVAPQPPAPAARVEPRPSAPAPAPMPVSAPATGVAPAAALSQAATEIGARAIVSSVGAAGRLIAMQVAALPNGGLERVVFDLCVGLKARGEKVVVIAVNGGGEFADELRRRGVTVHIVSQDLDLYERTLREVGVTDLFLHHSYFGIERAASVGVRLYDVVHNYYFWLRNNAKLVQRVSDLSARMIYVSAAVRTFHERLFGADPNKGVVINNPVHLDGLIVPDKLQLKRLRERSSETIFLNVAQAFPAKAQPAMISAFARARRGGANMRLQIAGAPVNEAAAQALRARIEDEGVADSVELLGHCDRRRISRLYAEAHAFVLPSLYEGYSVSAIEAATYGLPLILTAVGGAEDLIKSGCGILLPPATADLGRLEAREIEQLGLKAENDATAALERAFCDVTANRADWTSRALEAAFDVRSLDEAIDAYLASTPAAVVAR